MKPDAHTIPPGAVVASFPLPLTRRYQNIQLALNLNSTGAASWSPVKCW